MIEKSNGEYRYLNEGNMHIVFLLPKEDLVMKLRKLKEGEDPAREAETDPMIPAVQQSKKLGVFVPDYHTEHHTEEDTSFIEKISSIVVNRPDSKYERSVKLNFSNLIFEQFLNKIPKAFITEKTKEEFLFFEIKVKSSLDVLWSVKSAAAGKLLGLGATEEAVSSNLQRAAALAGKRLPNQKSQFFLRDCIDYMKNGKTEKLRKKLEGAFDGERFFSVLPQERVEAVKQLVGVETNYLRVFDSDGQKLKVDQYSELAKSIYGKEGWTCCLSERIAEALDQRLIRIMRFIQTIAGKSLGDLVLLLLELDFDTVVKSHNPDFLTSNAKDIIEWIFNEVDQQDFEQPLVGLSGSLETIDKITAALPSLSAAHGKLQATFVTLLVVMTMCDASIHVGVDLVLPEITGRTHLIDYSLKSLENVKKLLKVFRNIPSYLDYFEETSAIVPAD